jgi:hypothetical protein
MAFVGRCTHISQTGGPASRNLMELNTEGLSLRGWHGGPRPEQHLLAHGGGAALGDYIAALLGKRPEAFQAARKQPEARLRYHPLAHRARARDGAGDDRHPGPRERGEVGDDSVVGAVFE